MPETKKIVPSELSKFEKCFIRENNDNFLKGCKWSPDGTCILTASNDYRLRLFEINELGVDYDPTFCYREGGTVYDYAWYPLMSSTDPLTCVFASCSGNAPVHLWDACTGELRATYNPINQFDEVHPSYSLCFSATGDKLYCGFKKQIKIFELSYPGRDFHLRDVGIGQSGIISAIAVNPAMPSLYALGCYDKSVAIYAEPGGEMLCMMKAHSGGITQLMFSPDGNRLYTGARMDGDLICWDLRNPGSILFNIARTVKNCQRIYFDLTSDGRFLVTGSTDGLVSIFDTKQPPEDDGYLKSAISWVGHEDSTNGVSWHLRGDLLATASGQRHAFLKVDDEDEDEIQIENSLKIWKVPRNFLYGQMEADQETCNSSQ